MMRKILTSRKQFSAFSSRIITSELNHKLQHYESQEPTPNTIQHFLNLSDDRAALYNLLRIEIPVRLAPTGVSVETAEPGNAGLLDNFFIPL